MEATITDLINASAYGQNGVPHDLWTHLRKESPVYWYAQRGHTPFWAITKHEDIMEVSSQPDIFSNEAGGIIVLNEAQIQSFIEGGSGSPLAQMKTIITMDPPEHRSYRKVASGYFTPRGVTNLDEIVKSSAAAIFDELPDEGEVDFIETIAQKHPLRVLATILGINEEQEERLLVITQELFGGEDPDMQRQGEDRETARKELGMEFYMLFDEIIKDKNKLEKFKKNSQKKFVCIENFPNIKTYQLIFNICICQISLLIHPMLLPKCFQLNPSTHLCPIQKNLKNQCLGNHTLPELFS